MKTIKVSIIVWLLMYLGFAFVIANFNPMEWEQASRLFLVVYSAFINIMVVTYPRFNETR